VIARSRDEDGFPGMSGWGPKAAALTLSRYAHLEAIPKDWQAWHPPFCTEHQGREVIPF
jgi:hypothetical protein